MIKTPRWPSWGLQMLWAIVSLAPLSAFASPLWHNALADTPIADLVWIPIIAIVWSLQAIHSGTRDYPDDGELNLILGGLLAAMVGFVLILAPARWPASAVYRHGALLLWPLWILAMSWLFWGLWATWRLVAPLLYLLLVWPPIFHQMANATQALLVRWATVILDALAHGLPWLARTREPGSFSIVYHHESVLVVVAQACSGADSLLGAGILIPAVWFALAGRGIRKLGLSVLALVGALLINWVRLAILVTSVHVFGPRMTFGDIHPVLGLILFALLSVGLLALVRPLGLSVPAFGRTALPLPGWSRIATAITLSGLTFLFLWPVFLLPEGAFGNPQPVVGFHIRMAIPAIPAFRASPVYYSNESAQLGLGSATQTDMYTRIHGPGEVLAEVWSTPNAQALAAYGFHACLLYHGDEIVAVRSFQLEPGIVATAYALNLAPLQVGGRPFSYVDVEWSEALTYRGHPEFLRWSIAAFPASRPTIPVGYRVPTTLTALAPVQAMVAPAQSGTWSASAAQTRTVLVALAHTIFRRSLSAAEF